MKRVLFVSPHSLHGGAERYLTLLLDALGTEWIEGVVFLSDGPLVGRLRARGVPVAVIPASRRVSSIVRAAWRLRRLIDRSDVHVVHADGIKGALVAVLATAGRSTPVLWVKHDFSWDGVLARLVARRCGEVVAVSSAVAETFGPRARNVRIVHNGIPPVEHDRTAARERLVALLDPPRPSTIVGVFGRLHPAKGQKELVAVAPELRSETEGLRIVFVGGEDPSQPRYAAELRAVVAASGLSEIVAFLGERSDADALIAGCDVIVVPTVRDERGMGREGFGFVGLEAMAAGTPVVGYADGALPEVLGDCALLVSPGDRSALRDAILEVLGDPATCVRLVGCGRRRVSRLFRVEQTAAAMKARYVAVDGRRASNRVSDADT